LSHCWGEMNFLTLSRSNLEAFQAQIPQEALSQTFIDAIRISRDLGFSYLWIDSLCILQDDPNDWGRESALMSAVYGGSGLNIAVTVNEWIYIGLESVEGDEVVYIQEERGPSAVR
jgi:hypothetical protein